MSNKYEAMLVFSVANGDETAAELTAKFKAMAETNGTLDSVDEWGKRKLAYPINDETDGYYVILDFQSEPEFPAELDRVLKITDGVLRSIIIKK
ncbi:MAG: 30S ribosomal protein S6 [Clostridiales bacterium]|nr:30S ribosomal protein S6 [Clostridiales bacterium]